jgi:TetR/AcrR family transcriptional regulator, transcriptional repressor of bet genes
VKRGSVPVRSAKAIQRRRDLIEGAIGSIADLGYNNISFQTICEAAGVSRGLIGHYFDSKSDLLQEVFRLLVSEFIEESRRSVHEAGEDPVRRLLALVKFSTRWNDARSKVWLAYYAAAKWSPAMLEVYIPRWRRFRRQTEELIAKAARQRGVELDARIAALTLCQLLDGLWLGGVMDPKAYTFQDAERACRDYLARLLELDPAEYAD